MPADQALRRLVHGVGVERALDQPGAARVERQRRAAVDDAIEIMPRVRRKARIEIVRRRARAGRMATGCRPHMGVERVAQHIGAPDAGQIDMADLARGVDAGVGAPGAAHAAGSPHRARKRALDHFLHRKAIGLTLPADKAAAVIFDDELIARHAGASSQATSPHGEPRAAQKFRAASIGASPGALHLAGAQRALAAGDRQRLVETVARRARALAPRGAQNFHPLEALAEIGFEKGAGKGREARE